MTTPPLTITAYGLPAPQGSKRHVGRGVMVESSKNVKPWREDVRAAATAAVACLCPDDCAALRPGYPLDGPLVARMVFTFARPRSHYRTGRNAHLLRGAAPARPQSAPDLSKLLRSTEDALTSAGAWRDDARVVEYQRAAKVWVGEDPEALDAPGVVIRIWPLAAEPDVARPVVAVYGTRPPGPITDVALPDDPNACTDPTHPRRMASGWCPICHDDGTLAAADALEAEAANARR